MPSDTENRPTQPPTSNNDPSPPQRSKMLTLFNLIRTSVYGTVILFTVICLAMAGQFQSVLASSDLTRFVPFSIFVCSASLFIITLLLALSFFLRDRNPISTRIELSLLGLLGLFWLILGIYLAKSESGDADVECYSSAASTTPVADSAAIFHTEQYQAMYRVLNSFALLNAILVLSFCLGLLFLAIRRQRKGDDHMWHGPVTSCAWFNSYGRTTVKRGASGASSSSILPLTLPAQVAAPSRSRYVASRGPFGSGNRHGNSGRRGSGEKPLPTPGPMRQNSSGSPSIIGSFTSNEFERGGMINPNARSYR